MATAAAAARSIFRSSSVRSTAARASSQAKAKAARIQNNNSLSNRIFRCPVEASACLESLQPFHTATASALMTSMLTFSQRGYCWLHEANKPSYIPP